MQFLEWVVIGLRSARHVLTHGDRAVCITLFSMAHLGEPGFYRSVHDDAATHDIVVLEGVDSTISRRLTRVYRWAQPERLGLTVQPRFDEAGVRTIRADLPGEAFDRLWRQAPRRTRLMIETGAAAMGLWLRVTATRATIGRGLATTDLPDRDTILSWNERDAPMGDALMGARDAVLCDTLDRLLVEDPAPRRIAVIYGAAHMGVLSHRLFAAEFRTTDSRWMTVFHA